MASLRLRRCGNLKGEEGLSIPPVFGQRQTFRNRYSEQTYYLPAVRPGTYQDEEMCFVMRAINGYGRTLINYRVKFYWPAKISVGAARDEDDTDLVHLTCTGQRGGGGLTVTMYQGFIEEYYNPNKLVEDGELAARNWTQLMETGLIQRIGGHASGNTKTVSYVARLTPGHIVSMHRNRLSLFCAVQTKQEYLLEKFVLTAQHLGETIEI